MECPTERVSKMALNWDGKIFVDRRIKVTEHRTLNTCRGVIRSTELGKSTIEEAEECMKSQGVTKIHRVTRRNGDKIEQTNTYFITFAMPSPPDRVHIGMHEVRPVTLFQQKPLQCFNCQKFGHPKGKCKAKPVCGKCGHEAHENACPHAAICTNCKGDHAPSSRNCPAYKKEVAIQRLRAEKKISFAEAKREVEKTEPSTFSGRSYADIASQHSSAARPNPRIDLCSSVMQWPLNDILSEEERAEALAGAKQLKDSLSRRKKETPAQLVAGEQRDRNNKVQKKNKGPSKIPTPEGKRRGKKTSAQAQRPAPSPRPESGSPEKQVKTPALPNSRSNSGVAPVSAPQATEGKQAKPSDTSEKTPAPAPQAAGGGQAPGPAMPDKEEVEMEISQKTPAKEGATGPSPFAESPSGFSFGEKIHYFSSECPKDFNFNKAPKSKGFRKKGSSQLNRPKVKGVQLINRFDPLMPFQDPEEAPDEG